MKKRILLLTLFLLAALLLQGCAMRTVEEMYALPRRSEEFSQLQSAIDAAMENLTYAAPISGDNQQSVQSADLDGDGRAEYLVFAAGGESKPLQVLIFAEELDGRCYLREVIESNGTAFEQVEYVNFDERPGSELVIGRQVSDQVLRSVSVYSFADGSADQLFAIGYSKFLTCDLDSNGRSEVMVLRPGESETERGMALLYSAQAGVLQRSVETELSREPSQIRRLTTGKLQGGKPAVFVSSSSMDGSLVTDIFTMKNDQFSNISFSSESQTSIQTLLNFYVYPEDINEDGVMELPRTIPMMALPHWGEGEMNYLIQWFSMDTESRETDKLYTYHDFLGGWYLCMDKRWAERITVDQMEESYTFYVWDEGLVSAEAMFTIYVFTGTGRDEEAQKEGRFPLYRAEGIVCAAKLHEYSAYYDITKDYLTDAFHLIRQEWRTGDSEG